MDRSQFRSFIVSPILKIVNLWSETAEHMIVGTVQCESEFMYVKQQNGPAVSLLQIEPFTYRDLRKRLLTDYKRLATIIQDALYLSYFPENADYLMGNVSAAVIFARLKYYFDSEPLPDKSDFEGMAKYYKRVYNTVNGAADLNRCIKIFRSVVLNYTDTLSQKIN